MRASVLTLNTARREVDSRILCCQEEIEYQQRLWALLAKLCRRPNIQTVVATNLLCLLKVFRHFCFAHNRAYWSMETHIKGCVRAWQLVFSGWQNREFLVHWCLTVRGTSARSGSEGRITRPYLLVRADAVDNVLLYRLGAGGFLEQ